jgi:type I restriction enzyme M protein
VDGVLHYARHLSREFNVIAVAVSGDTRASLKVTTYLHTKGTDSPKLLNTRHGKPIDSIISWRDYIEHATFDPSVQRMRIEELMAFSRELHEFMRDHAKLAENEKPLMVSGTLIALRNKAFSISFGAHSPVLWGIPEVHRG